MPALSDDARIVHPDYPPMRRLPPARRSAAHVHLMLAAALLLFAAALRFQHLVDFLEWPDEIRTAWRAQGSFEDLLIRTPPDWPPTYGVLMWGWARLAGEKLETQRLLMALFGVLATALIYRAALALTHQRRMALLAGLLYAAAGYAIFAGVDVRAYGLLLALGALAVWQMLRWLARPNWRRAGIAALALAALFYLSYTSLVFIAFLLVFALALHPRPRWLGLSGLTALLLLPVFPAFLASAGSRLAVMPQPLPPLGEAILEIYGDYGGSVWFGALLAAAGLTALWSITRRLDRWRRVGLLLVWSLAPLAVYFILNNKEFIETRYTWWVLIGLILLIADAAAHLPRLAQLGVTAAVIAYALFVPVDFSAYRLPETTSPPFRAVLSWFAAQLRPGDVLVIDPYCTCGEPFAWDYFLRQSFPTGYLPLVDHPGEAARVWYLSTTGWQQDEALKAAVMDGRSESIFAGPWYFLLRLYEAPPLRAGVSFGGRVGFHGVEIARNDTILAQNDRVDVRLWWSAQTALDADYSISLAILDARGRLVAQADGAPHFGSTPAQMSAWTPGVYYEDHRTLQLPPDSADGDYVLVVTVYQWWDGVRLQPESQPEFAARDDGYLEIARLRMTS